jgi:phosphoribosylformylglycinamidine synthase subunit PurSL
MTIYRFVVRFNQSDPRSAGYLHDARALGFDNLQRIACQDLFFIEGQLLQEECNQLALKLLTDPVTQTFEVREMSKVESQVHEGQREMDNLQPLAFDVVEVALRPGVTDPVSEQIVRAAHELGFDGVHRASTGLRFQLEGLTVAQTEKLARQLLANNVIQHWKIGEIAPSFPEEVASSGEVELIPLRDLSDEALLAVSKARRAALDLAEMRAIQNYFRAEQRDPTDVEFEMIAQTWSEHCVHKTFKAKVEVERVNLEASKQGSMSTNLPVYSSTYSEVNSIIKTYLKAATDKINAPWVISAFVDNAGIIDFDDEYEISFKVETHNHPSAIEPFGGANTGVGGVIRDVIGVSAKPIANTDILCFGPQSLDPDTLPDGVLHPRRIQGGVVAGVQDYGNKIGIPTVNGAILYDEGYTANPLVFCGCVGLAPKGKHTKSPRPGDRVIVIGGRTGRDGLRGATFSSMTMDAQTGEVSGASVQIGDPITEKGLIDVVVRARDLGLYTDITDCGAGGLSSAVGEMTSKIGGDVDLSSVRLKYPGLAPWEIWLSEAQERMVLAIPPENIPALQELCDTFDTELTDIGAFTGEERIVVRYGEKIVLALENEFLHEGIPQRQLKAVIGKQIEKETGIQGDTEIGKDLSTCLPDYLLKLLSHPNIASKAHVIRLYDHEIQGGTVVKPLTGAQNDGPSDAAVLKPIGTLGTKGIVLSNGVNPEYGKRDAYKMAWAVVDEAVRNAVAVGADPARIAILDNFCWGDPLRPETLGTLVEACRGCHDAAMHYGTPFISGKDSLNNEYMGADGQRHSIPPTLLISALGMIEDVNQSITMDLKEAGNLIYLVGEFAPTFGGSHLGLVNSGSGIGADEPVPVPSLLAPQVYAALHSIIKQGLVRSAHDLSEGGLAVAAAEMCIGGRLGMELSLESDDSIRSLFGETNGCLLVEVKPEKAADFEKLLENLPKLRVATVIERPTLTVINKNQMLITIPVDELVMAWNKTA